MTDSEQYTPSMEEVRLAYTTAGDPGAEFGDIVAEFDRWLAAHDAEVARAAAEACAQIAKNAQEGWYYEAIESGAYDSGGESAARHIAEEIRATYRLEQADEQ